MCEKKTNIKYLIEQILILITCELIWEKQNLYKLVESEPIQLAPTTVIYGVTLVFYECGFVSYQDTLFDAMNHNYFKNCYIECEVDFIYDNDQCY